MFPLKKREFFPRDSEANLVGVEDIMQKMMRKSYAID